MGRNKYIKLISIKRLQTLMSDYFFISNGISIGIPGGNEANTVEIRANSISIGSNITINSTGSIFGDGSNSIVITQPIITVVGNSSNISITPNNILLNGADYHGTPKVTIFTANGTFVPNAQATTTKITLVGGGGSGGSTANGTSTTTAFSSGGLGGGAIEIVCNNSLISNQTVIVGNGGNAVLVFPSNGNNGGNTYFGNSTANATAFGGNGGTYFAAGTSRLIDNSSITMASATNSISGTATIIPASPPKMVAFRLNGTNATGGASGYSIFGVNTISPFRNATNFIGTYEPSNAFGCGGTGSVSFYDGATKTNNPGLGCKGSDGIVIVEEYFN